MEATSAAAGRSANPLARYLPVLNWLPGYKKQWLPADLIAGVTVAAFCIPESMAYAGLAGLPPQAGLYASLLAVLAYALFGTSRQAAIGPTSALSILVATGLGALSLGDPARYGAMAALLAVMVGVIAIAARVLRLGFLVNFISETVLTGFSAGAAIYIGTTQLGKLFGIEGANGEFIDRIAYIAGHLGETQPWALGLGLAGIVFLLGAEKLAPRVPWALVVVAVAILLMNYSGLGQHGIKVTGAIPSGLPPFHLPSLEVADIRALLPSAFAVFLLSYVEGMGVVRAFAARHKYQADANQELLAVGAANVLCGVGSAMPVGCSMSRSAVSDQARAQTPLAGAFSGLILGIIVLFFAGVFTQLPEPILAAVVLIAVKGLVDVKALRRLFHANRVEFWLALVAMAGVLLFGMLEGVMIGVVVSLLLLVWRVSYPHTATLGRVPGTERFADIARHKDNVAIPDVLLFRVDAGLFYANVPNVKEDLLDLIESQPLPPRLVVMDLSSSPNADLAASDMLKDLCTELAERGIELRVSNVNGRVRDLLRRDGADKVLGDFGPQVTPASVVRDWQAHHVEALPS